MDVSEINISSVDTDDNLFSTYSVKTHCHGFTNFSSQSDGNSQYQSMQSNSNIVEGKTSIQPLNVKTERLENSQLFDVPGVDDESMAVEALRELGNSALYVNNSVDCVGAKLSNDLPILSCIYCNLQFRNTTNLNNHLSFCKSSDIICQFCNQQFSKQNDLDDHNVIHHSIDRSYKEESFINEEALLQHSEPHGLNSNVCQICHLNFNKLSSLTNHMKIHNYQPGRALVQKQNKSLSDVLTNFENDEGISKTNMLPSIQSLTQANWTFKSNDYLNRISFTDTQNISDETDKINSYINELDHDEFYNKKDEMLNINTTSKPYNCSYCNKNFAREKALLSHIKIHVEILENFYQCDKCDSCFSSNIELSKHALHCNLKEKTVESYSRILNSEKLNAISENTVKAKNSRHVCTECSKRFSTKQKLFRHMWIHRKKTYSCETCSVNFEKQQDLDAHRLHNHQGTSPYICTECGKNFSSRQGLWEHCRIHGTDMNLYKCEECLKTFTSRQGYLIHKRKHNNERPYGCRFCWKAFRDGGTLRKHERIHTGERPHVCPLCSKAFNQKVVLREHIRWLHTVCAELDSNGCLNCTLCDAVFVEKDELCAHIVKHSDQMAQLVKKSSKIGEINKIELNSKQDVSSEKLENLSGENAVNFNIELIDKKTSKVACDMCGITFLNKLDLAKHIRIHIQ